LLAVTNSHSLNNQENRRGKSAKALAVEFTVDVLCFQCLQAFDGSYGRRGSSFTQSYRCYPASFIEKVRKLSLLVFSSTSTLEILDLLMELYNRTD